MSARRLVLELESSDFDVPRDEIRWTWCLCDDRLDSAECYLHVATDRCGSVVSVHHTVVDGLCWDEVDQMDGEGWPLDDAELADRLRFAIRAELARVDLARLLLVHYPPKPFQVRRRVA